MICPKCGAENQDNADFCSLCLTRFKEVENPPVTNKHEQIGQNQINQRSTKPPENKYFVYGLIGIAIAALVIIVFIIPLFLSFSKQLSTFGKVGRLPMLQNYITLQNTASPEQIDMLTKEIKSYPEVKSVKYFSRQEFQKSFVMINKNDPYIKRRIRKINFPNILEVEIEYGKETVVINKVQNSKYFNEVVGKIVIPQYNSLRKPSRNIFTPINFIAIWGLNIALNGLLILAILLISYFVSKSKKRFIDISGQVIEMATITRRFVAIFIDGLIFSLILMVFGFSLLKTNQSFFTGTSNPSFDFGSFMQTFAMIAALIIIVTLLHFSYLVISEWQWGQTIGKRIAGIKVIAEDKNPLTLSQSFVRNILRIVDGFFGNLVGFIAIIINPKWQRVGDVAAKTIVIRDSQNQLTIPSDQVLQINDADPGSTYSPSQMNSQETTIGPLAIVSLILTLIGYVFPFGFFLVTAGLVLAIIERKSINEGGSPKKGKALTSVSIASGLIYFVISIMVFMYLFIKI